MQKFWIFYIILCFGLFKGAASIFRCEDETNILREGLKKITLENENILNKFYFVYIHIFMSFVIKKYIRKLGLRSGITCRHILQECRRTDLFIIKTIPDFSFFKIQSEFIIITIETKADRKKGIINKYIFLHF